MSHANNSHPTIEIARNNNSEFSPSHESTSRGQQNLNMAPNAGLFDPDTKVYYAKKYRQLWASGPASMVSVLAGVSRGTILRMNGLTSPRHLSRMSKRECNRKSSLYCLVINSLTYAENIFQTPG